MKTLLMLLSTVVTMSLSGCFVFPGEYISVPVDNGKGGTTMQRAWANGNDREGPETIEVKAGNGYSVKIDRPMPTGMANVTEQYPIFDPKTKLVVGYGTRAVMPRQSTATGWAGVNEFPKSVGSGVGRAAQPFVIGAVSGGVLNLGSQGLNMIPAR